MGLSWASEVLHGRLKKPQKKQTNSSEHLVSLFFLIILFWLVFNFTGLFSYFNVLMLANLPPPSQRQPGTGGCLSLAAGPLGGGVSWMVGAHSPQPSSSGLMRVGNEGHL